MNSETISFLIKEIKDKPQLVPLDDSFIEKYITNYFLRNGDVRKKIEELEKLNTKNKIIKTVVKEIRKEIGEVFGSYQTAQHKKKLRYLEEENIEEILKCHKSTRERMEFYPLIYKTIFDWYMPNNGVADIACGFNPVSYPILEKIAKKKFNYYVSDLSKEDMSFISLFFTNNNLNGKAIALDATNKEFIEDEDFKKCDLVFLLKALDSFESDKKNSSKDLLLELPQNKIVISFPTKSLVAQKEVSTSKRNWIFSFIKKQNWSYETFEIENELFILISKN